MRLNSTLQAVLIFSLHILFNCYVNANGSIVRTKRARALDIRRSHSSPRARPSRRRARPRYVDGVKPTPTPILTPRRPIIGLVTQVRYGNSSYSFVLDSYVKFLEQAGAGVVGIRVGQSESYYSDLFNNINGVLFPGGSAVLNSSYYGEIGRLFYKWAIKANARGDYFPIWGTCLGFELLATVTAGSHILTNCSSSNDLLPLNLTKGFRQSRLFLEFPSELVKPVQLWNVTQHHHKSCVSVKDFMEDAHLSSFYQVLSTNVDRNGKLFVSTMEAKRFPFYGTQWHPEKNSFTWDIRQNVNHSTDAIQLSQYMAQFFVNEAKKSNHHFRDLYVEAAVLVENQNAAYEGYPSFYSAYRYRVPAGIKTASRRHVSAVSDP